MPVSPDIRKKVAGLLREAATPLRKLAGDVQRGCATGPSRKTVINIDNLRGLLRHGNR